MKELKNYIKHYVGCNFKTPKGIMELTKYDRGGGRYKAWFGYVKQNIYVLDGLECIARSFPLSSIKPILRPYSDATDKEKVDIGAMLGYKADSKVGLLMGEEFFEKPQVFLDTVHVMSHIVFYLMEHSFDPFGLIGAGIAIDKTKL
jgi:hypothetical protein